MTIDDVTKACAAILNASKLTGSTDSSGATSAGETYYAISIDDKFPTPHIKAMGILGIASICGLAATTPGNPDRHLLCVQSTDLNNKTLLSVLTTGLDKLGTIVAVEVTYTATPTYVYEYAEPDSATAIRDYLAIVALGTIPMPSLFSYAIEGAILYHPGVKGRLTYVPNDLGQSTSALTSFPDKYGAAVIAEALSLLFAFDADPQYLQAAGYFEGKAEAAKKLILDNRVESIPAVMPFEGA